MTRHPSQAGTYGPLLLALVLLVAVLVIAAAGIDPLTHLGDAIATTTR